MSLYSELMGSFIRTGNYPLEADYIFATEEELKEFYSDALNATLLHKGWLKVVENDGEGNQALYWVTVDENDELVFTKLITSASLDNVTDKITEIEDMLQELEDKINQEITDRETADNAIWGTTDKTELPDDLNSLLDLANAIQELRDLIANNSEDIDNLRELLMATVGTEDSDIISYLQTLPYQSLTLIANELNKFLNEVDSSTSKINTLPELQNFLEGYTDSDTLKEILENLVNDIYGSPLPTEDFRTLRGIEDFVRTLKLWTENRTDNLLTELDLTLVGVGLSGDGSYSADQETYYLQDATSVMNALKILDSLVYEALLGITINVDNSDVVELAVRKDSEGYTIGAKLNISNVYGNQILKKDDGVYMSVSSDYDDGILTIKVNDNIIALHILGFSNLVDSAYYDTSNEQIVIVFKLLSGENLTINIPVGALIREWEPDNTNSDRVVELYRETVVDGADKVSADVRIAEDTDNILEKSGNTLIVRGTSDNITHNGQTLESYLESLQETSDSTNETLTLHINNTDNPHEVTAEQIGLGNVDNTSDVDKPISTAQQEALDSLEQELTSNIESIKSTIDEYTVNGYKISENPVLTKGDIGLDQVDNTSDLDKPVSTAQLEALDLVKETIDNYTVNGYLISNNPALTKSDVGLDLVDNTADLDKPISTATLTALDEKAPIYSPILQGVPQVEESPDLNDSSLRIPSTNWVNLKLEKDIDSITLEIITNVTETILLDINLIKDDLNNHISDYDNPHQTTAELVSSYTLEEVNDLLTNKADLVDGKVPEDLLPECKIQWNEV